MTRRGPDVPLEEQVAVLWVLVELLLAQVIEHCHDGDSAAMWQEVSPQGRDVLNMVAEHRMGMTL